jgi:hypothetical protein
MDETEEMFLKARLVSIQTRMAEVTTLLHELDSDPDREASLRQRVRDIEAELDTMETTDPKYRELGKERMSLLTTIEHLPAKSPRWMELQIELGNLIRLSAVLD